MPEKPSQPPDFIDWDRLRESNEYLKYLMRYLRVFLEATLLPDFLKKQAEKEEKNPAPHIDEYFSPEDWEDDYTAWLPNTPEELELKEQIFNLKTVDDFKRFCSKHGIEYNLDQLTKEAEKDYMIATKLRHSHTERKETQ